MAAATEDGGQRSQQKHKKEEDKLQGKDGEGICTGCRVRKRRVLKELCLRHAVLATGADEEGLRC